LTNTGEPREVRRRTRPHFAAFERPKLFVVEQMRNAFWCEMVASL
jgi:hypothetical protein